MEKLPLLTSGDWVEIIAPASRFTQDRLDNLKTLLRSWQLNYIIANDILGDDILCANSDEIRFKNLKRVLHNSQTKAVICISGGYGSMRLIPDLIKISTPPTPKIFVGMSDTVALQLYLQQNWYWPTVHGAPISEKFSDLSIETLRKLLSAHQLPIAA